MDSGTTTERDKTPRIGSLPERGITTKRPGRGRKIRGIEIVVDESISGNIESKEALRVSTHRNRKNKGRDAEAAAERAAKRVGTSPGKGNRSNVGSPPLQLPFESTLAFAFRHSGGKETAINAARLVEDERYQRLVWAYDNGTQRDKDTILLEDLCKIADIPADEFLGTVISALWKRQVDIGRLTAIAAHPEIVNATIEAAKTAFGNADRRFLLDHAGFLPKASGQIINIDTRHQTVITHEGAKGLPSFEEEGKEVHAAVRAGQRQLLEAPNVITNISPQVKPDKTIIDAEVEDVPRD
jgi:hypothetical protein